MKVIFLDFDGVLTSERFLRQLTQLGEDTEDAFGTIFDPECIDYLRTIVEQTGAMIVLITSWKREGEGPLQKLWEGRQMPGILLGITPNDLPAPTVECDADGMLPANFNLFSLHSKGREIEVWMERNRVPDKYVIIDDWPDFTPEQMNHYVRTNSYIGLAEADVKRCIALLE